MKRLLDPLLLGTLAFVGQASLWYLGMPETPSIPGAAPRFVNNGSLVIFAVFAIVYLWAIGGGKLSARLLLEGRERARRRRRRRSRHGTEAAEQQDQAIAVQRAQWRLAYLWRVATAAVLLAMLGELLYVRQLLANPSIILNAFSSGSFTNIGEQAAGERLVGLSSLNNLFVVPVAIYALIYFSTDVTAAERGRAGRRLAGIGAAVLLHAFLFVGRQNFVSMLLIIGGAFLFSGQKKSRAFWQLAATLVVLVAFLVWMGEVLRSGSYYAHSRNIGLFSGETQSYVLHRLIEGYFAADFNNAMVVLSCEPPNDWIGTTMWAAPASRFGFEPTYFAHCSRWVSQFGTMNVIGNWWWDAEWWGLLFALASGLWLGVTSVVALRLKGPPGFSAVVYLITFPGIISLTRINYFGETIFVAPVLFMWAAWVLRPHPSSLRTARRRRRPLAARHTYFVRLVPTRKPQEGRQ